MENSWLVVGSVFRPIFDKLQISREKLAYICDSTSAPVCILIPINSWGAYIIALLAAQGVSDPFFVLLKSLFFNWYALLALIMVMAFAINSICKKLGTGNVTIVLYLIAGLVGL